MRMHNIGIVEKVYYLQKQVSSQVSFEFCELQANYVMNAKVKISHYLYERRSDENKDQNPLVTY